MIIDDATPPTPQDKKDRISLMRAANPDAIFTADSKGRTLQIVRLGPAAMLNVIEMAGGAAADNQTWLRMAMMLSSLKSIDGIPVRPTKTKGQFLELADEIGNEGLIAISDATTGPKEDDTAATPDEEREAELAASRSRESATVS